MSGELSQHAVGVRNRIERRKDPPHAEPFGDARVMGRRERQRRLAHARAARDKDWPIFPEDRVDKLLPPILAADHVWVLREGRRIRRY
jgi:hypothetical protein